MNHTRNWVGQLGSVAAIWTLAQKTASLFMSHSSRRDSRLSKSSLRPCASNLCQRICHKQEEGHLLPLLPSANKQASQPASQSIRRLETATIGRGLEVEAQVHVKAIQPVALLDCCSKRIHPLNHSSLANIVFTPRCHYLHPHSILIACSVATYDCGL